MKFGENSTRVEDFRKCRTGKVCYDKKGATSAMNSQTTKRRLKTKKIESYWCDKCNFWHITTQGKKLRNIDNFIKMDYKTRKVRPIITTRQKIAFKEVMKGSTISGAMKKAGYADTTASTTGKLTNTPGWKILVERHLSDKLLVKKHREGLDATIKGEPDYSTRHRYLESAYKVKGKYGFDPEKPENTQNITIQNVLIQIRELNERGSQEIRQSPAEPVQD